MMRRVFLTSVTTVRHVVGRTPVPELSAAAVVLLFGTDVVLGLNEGVAAVSAIVLGEEEIAASNTGTNGRGVLSGLLPKLIWSSFAAAFGVSEISRTA